MRPTQGKLGRTNAAALGGDVKIRGHSAVLLLSALLLASIQARSDEELHVVRLNTASGGQGFVCVSPYTIAECERQVAILRPVLHRYHAESLGKWTWVLVRSEDWNEIVTRLHLNPNSPAFSHLEMRQTFLEEALLVPKPERQIQLLKMWHIPFGEFLNVAVSHELGHAFCDEADEAKADRAGQRLRKGQLSVCEIRKRKTLDIAGSRFPVK